MALALDDDDFDDDDTFMEVSLWFMEEEWRRERGLTRL